ncbi:MAG: flp pilus-assembly TadE/G-like family protein, partial [Propionibacteriales bacterium]|nr:flp pilus-assembly TadE/G-like family protein [Propionibacteriales bacterium]
GAVAAQHHLDGSADLASLAGAAALQQGRDGCAVARQTAADNGVHVVNCSLVAGDLVVAVEDTVPLPFGIDGILSSAARAGPDAGS